MDNIKELAGLVERFEADLTIYKQGNQFNEQMTRQQYIDNFLKYLGWDISNSKGLSFNEREVVAEEYSIDNKRDRPDYTIRINGVSKFYIEAKKVSVDIFNEIDPALQARRYGWNSNHKISILTNFEYLIIYTTYEMPSEKDNASTYRYKYYHFSEYVKKFDEIYSLISRDAVLSGDFDKWTSRVVPEDATKSSLDTVFLDQLNNWRLEIGRELYTSSEYDNENMDIFNEEIQEFLNQIIFLRFAEDNHYESVNLLKNDILSQPNYIEYFKKLDKKYNSGLFKNSRIISIISYGLLEQIVENLYFPLSSYDFSIIDLSILSRVYENFLQEELVEENNQIHLRKTKSASIKAVISTPYEVVVAMVNKVLGQKIEGKTPEEILSLRIADLAVGSGIFLIEVYNYLENYLIQWYSNVDNVNPNNLVIPFDIKREIVEKVLVGFDINNQAVQLTRFSLLLRILSHEGKERLEKISPILPSLEENIKCGNSLVSFSDVDNIGTSIDELIEINPSNDKIFSEAFDVIIGNPPYLTKRDIIRSTLKKEIEVYENKYLSAKKQYDKYLLFIEKSLESIKSDGEILLLVPNKFIVTESAKGIREILQKRKFLKKIFDFRYTQIFPTATNYVSVIHLMRSDEFEYVEISEPSDVYEDKKGLAYSVDDLQNDQWFLTSEPELKSQYEFAIKHFPSMTSEVIPKNGIQTSSNSVYIISKNKINEDNDFIYYKKNDKLYKIEKELLKNFAKPDDMKVGRSYNNLLANSYVIFPYIDGKVIPESILEKKYPGAFDYLLDHKDILLPKVMGGKRDVRGSNSEVVWYQFGRAQFLKEVKDPKIIVGVLSNEPNFNIDTKGFTFASGGTAGYIGLYLREKSKYTLEYMQAWLSHSFTDRIFQTIGSSFEGEFYTHGTQLYEKVPLLPVDFESLDELAIFEKINKLVRKVSDLNDRIEKTKESRIQDIIESQKQNVIKEINFKLDELLRIKMKG